MKLTKLWVKWKGLILNSLTQIKCYPAELQSGKQIILLKGLVIIVITSFIFYENIWMTFVMLPYLIVYIKEQKKICDDKEKLKRREEFKDGLMAVSFSLNVGYSVENSFREAVIELQNLYGKDCCIAKEFKNIVRRVDHNENLEDILDDFAAKSEIEDILYFAEVFRFAKRSGGDLISIIHTTAQNIRQKTEVNGEIYTLISGKKMEQKVMSIIPYGIIIYLKATSPEFIEPLYGNIVGIAIMTICLVLLLISNYCAKRIVDIEV